MPAEGGDRSAEADSRPRILIVGHLTEDMAPEGPRLGGAAAFAGLLAHRFGAPVRILTAVDAAFPYLGALDGIAVHRLPSPDRTRFRNRYRSDGSREQTILSRARLIPETAIRQAVAALPPGSAVFYGPVANELGGAGPLPRPHGRGAFAVAAPQGMLRRWDSHGRISVHWTPRAARRFAGLDLVSLSESELPEAIGGGVSLLAVTRGRRGAVIRRAGLPEIPVPAVPGVEVDPTGAGDVFAAALGVALWRGSPLERAAGLAAAAAAISVESPGVAGVPTLEEAAARLSASGAGYSPGSPGRR